MDIAEKTLAWAKKQGAVICQEPAEKQRLAEYVVPVAALFPDLIAQVVGIYPYYMLEQGRDDLKEADGITWEYYDTKTDRKSYAVGISVEGLEAGPEYTAFLFLHELAHTVTGCEHNTAFHDQLNSMIKTYNQSTGANIANDLFGWPSRHDYRPYNPFGAALYTTAPESR